MYTYKLNIHNVYSVAEGNMPVREKYAIRCAEQFIVLFQRSSKVLLVIVPALTVSQQLFLISRNFT